LLVARHPLWTFKRQVWGRASEEREHHVKLNVDIKENERARKKEMDRSRQK
jgi:hypothetical protein